jgi:hypothetical protein
MQLYGSARNSMISRMRERLVQACGSGMWFGRADLVFRPPVSMTGRSDECTPFHNRDAEKS